MDISHALHIASELLLGVNCDLTARVESGLPPRLTIDLYRSFDSVRGQSPFLDVILSCLEGVAEIEQAQTFILPIVKYTGDFHGLHVTVNARKAVSA